MRPAEIPMEGTLPGGGRDKARVRVAGIIAFIAMKGIAMATRLKEKDPWDVYYCVRNYPGGPAALAAEFAVHVGHGLVREGLQHIAEKFASPDHIGPKSVADFEELTDSEEIALVRRDAYERVRDLLQRLGIGAAGNPEAGSPMVP
jgi:hypothetical protein